MNKKTTIADSQMYQNFGLKIKKTRGKVWSDEETQIIKNNAGASVGVLFDKLKNYNKTKEQIEDKISKMKRKGQLDHKIYMEYKNRITPNTSYKEYATKEAVRMSLIAIVNNNVKDISDRINLSKKVSDFIDYFGSVLL